MDPIYLDYNATAPADPAVVEAMLPFFNTYFGNAMSIHSFGQRAAQALEAARTEVAALVNCRTSEVIFTSGGTESNNAALRGVARARRKVGNHIITSEIEHPSIIKVCRELMEEGFQITFLPVDHYGQIDINKLRDAVTDHTILISVMHANNEVGTIQPIAEIGQLARARGIYFHCDAAQSMSKLPVDVEQLNIDLLTIAAHKFYGPKGIGALIAREGVELAPYMLGAGHESGRRAGTVNVAGAAGLGKACELARTRGTETIAAVRRLRDLFHALITEAFGDTTHTDARVHLNGHPSERLPNTLNLSFRGADGQQLLARTNIAASLGAACHTSSRQPSAVLSAMGADATDALGAVRFSFGKFTPEAEVREAAARVINEFK